MNQHVENWQKLMGVLEHDAVITHVGELRKAGFGLVDEVRRLEIELAAYKKYETQPRPLPGSILTWRGHPRQMQAYESGHKMIETYQREGDALVKDLEDLHVDYVRAVDSTLCYPKTGEPYRWQDRVTELEKELAQYRKYEFQPRPVLESVLVWRCHSKNRQPQETEHKTLREFQEQGDALVHDIELLTNENMRLIDELKASKKKLDVNDLIDIAPRLKDLHERLKSHNEFDSYDEKKRIVAIDCNEAADQLLKIFDLAYGIRTDGQPFLWKDVVEKIERTLKAKLAKAHRAREAAETAKGAANLRATVLERKTLRHKRRIVGLTQELLQAKKDGACDVCKGTGKPFRDETPCVCGGSGKMRDALEHFRKRLLFGDEKAIAPNPDLKRLIFELDSHLVVLQQTRLPDPLTSALAKAIEWLQRLNKSNDDLRRRLNGIHQMYQNAR